MHFPALHLEVRCVHELKCLGVTKQEGEAGSLKKNNLSLGFSHKENFVIKLHRDVTSPPAVLGLQILGFVPGLLHGPGIFQVSCCVGFKVSSALQ